LEILALDIDMIRALIINSAFIILTFGLSLEGSGQFGCTNANSCNYDPGASLDDGSCYTEKWFVPTAPGTGAPVEACSAPPSYQLINQSCYFVVIASQPSCSSNWTESCVSTYAECVGCEPVIWIPDELGSGRAIFSCSPLENYHIADQNCAQSVLSSNPGCWSNRWGSDCQLSYETCLGCANARLYIPLEGVSGSVQTACERPENYMLADVSCLETSVFGNPNIDLFENDWNDHYSIVYRDCIRGPYNLGCTYEDAVNFDPNAAHDDGSCIFIEDFCPQDINNDDVINTADLTALLASYGQYCE
jgi:hypothetical protein